MENPKMVTMSGAEAIATAMKECGIEYFFFMMAGGINLVTPEMQKLGINTIMCRNEKSCTNMADGYSRVSKKPSVCYGQHGSAAAILASMMFEPEYAHTPVIALTSSHSHMRRDMWDYQATYEMNYFEATCKKFNVDVTHVSRLGDYMRSAIQQAVSGCPGPTHVNYMDHLPAAVGEMPEIYGDKTFKTLPPFRPRADRERVAEAAKLLLDAKRPVLFCGTGVHLSDAYDEVKELAELLAIPVATNYGGKGCFPEDNPLYIGTPGIYGRPVTGDILHEADVVFFVAMRANPHQTEEFRTPARGGGKIIHLDIEPAVLGRMYKPDVALLGDAKVTLQDLVDVIKTTVKKPRPQGDRIKELRERITAYENSVTREGTDKLNSDDVPIWPQRIVNEVSKFITPKDIVVTDTGNQHSYNVLFLKLKGTGRHYLPTGGTLGASFGMAIGASFGAKEGQRVIHLTGDAGMGYNLADIETSVRYKDKHVPMVTIVNNNSVIARDSWPLSPVNYAKIFEACGGYGIRVEKPGDIRGALEEAFKSGKPACLDCLTEPKSTSRMGGVQRATFK